MRIRFRARIAVRSTVLVLAVSLLVGIPMLIFLAEQVRKQESTRQQATLMQLLDTVERTAQIASYLGDMRLSEELCAGLLKNDIVGQVVITSGDLILASQSRPAWKVGMAPPVIRVLRSPFNADFILGRLTVFPDETAIERQIIRRGRAAALLLGFQAMAVAGACVLVVLLLVTRPITRLSHGLHQLMAETGETLAPIRGHRSDEIGRLVGDVNALVNRLMTFVHAERFLRDEVEHEHALLLEAKQELERSLVEVKTLQGLLPICAWCKKIRDDEGLWTQIEQYVTENTEARFSHGLCPDCAQKEFADFRAQKKDDQA